MRRFLAFNLTHARMERLATEMGCPPDLPRMGKLAWLTDYFQSYRITVGDLLARYPTIEKDTA